MTKSSAIDVARVVLGGDDAFQHLTRSHRNILETLQNIVTSERKGQVAMVTGESGCGVSTLLRNLQQQHPDKAVSLKGDIYTYSTSILHHICGVFHLEIDNYDRKVPAYLPKFARVSGLETVIVDDLDIYIERTGDLDEVYRWFDLLTSTAEPISIIFSTRNIQLVRRFLKRQRHTWKFLHLSNKPGWDEYCEMANCYWDDMNQRLGVLIPKPTTWHYLADMSGTEIHQALQGLRIEYACRVLAQSGVDLPSRREMTLNDYEYELQDICYR